MARIVLEDKILNEDLVNAPWTQSRLLKIQDPESRYFYHNMTKATVGGYWRGPNSVLSLSINS
jgi:hypothetical protein